MLFTWNSKVNCFRIFRSHYLLIFSIKHIVLKHLGRIVIADCSYLSFTELKVSNILKLVSNLVLNLKYQKISGNLLRDIFHSQHHTCSRQFSNNCKKIKIEYLYSLHMQVKYQLELSNCQPFRIEIAPLLFVSSSDFFLQLKK